MGKKVVNAPLMLHIYKATKGKTQLITNIATVYYQLQ
jgi:hypothetical protein